MIFSAEFGITRQNSHHFARCSMTKRVRNIFSANLYAPIPEKRTLPTFYHLSKLITGGHPIPFALPTTPIGKIIMLELLEILDPHATIISAVSAAISAIAVLVSTGFVIWTTCFRKTRRDRVDELKLEIQVLLSQRGNTPMLSGDMEILLRSLESKFQEPKYKILHRCAFNEAVGEFSIVTPPVKK